MPNAAGEMQHGSASPIIARAASYNHIPALNPERENIDIKRTFSEVNLSQCTESKPDSDGITTGKQILRQSSLRSNRENTKLREPQFTLPTEETPEKVDLPLNDKESLKPVERPQKPRSVAGALADRFRRKKRRTSRSPSPSRQPSSSSKSGEEPTSTTNGQAVNRQRRKSSGESAEKKSANSERDPQDDATSARAGRNVGTTAGRNKNGSSAGISRKPSLKTLRRRPSMDRFTASVGISTKGAPPVPKPPKNQDLSLKTTDTPRPKDELWSVFRGLDADYQKFQSKSSTFKANVVRLTLIPCLARYSDHPSTKLLRPEDLDRRINILNKWWIGLLEMLNGRNSLSLTGTDRPVYLEAILAIMTRPEWRVPPFSHPSPITPFLKQKQPITAPSNTSLESTGSDFLVESIHHNIRNIFAQNLLSQLAYCFDRMSMRHTPASLVAFCGKTCAHAFFFCPQVADMLVRVWDLSPDHLRRVANRFDISPCSRTRSAMSEDIAANFPAPARSLAFVSHASLVRYLRRKALGPLAASHIDWLGQWNSRWMGFDTDLFFVFVKNFHLLVADFFPEETKTSSLVYVPGLIPVHAQILAVLENTLNKQSVPPPLDTMHGPTSITFDDLIDGADAPATTLPLGTANKYRTMSENRLVTLLRDFLRDTTIRPATKQVFAESFCEISKSAARRTSLFNHSGCFVLCDFIEELMSVIPPYCQLTDQPDILDWEFWFQVCKQMLQSNNSVTEVRAFAFLFATWNALSVLDQRKEHICLEMLLQERFFFEYFNHWSPMVRAYFHRLICWRVARHDGDASELDTRIYSTLADRLCKNWNFYLSFQVNAQKLSTAPMPTTPCPPAPGRRLIIIRNDYDYPNPNLLACLGDIVPSSLNSTQQADQKENEDIADTSAPQFKRGWRMLKTMFSSPNNPKPGEVTPPGTRSEDAEFPGLDDSKDATIGSQTQPPPPNGNAPSEPTSENSTKSQRRSSFRFTMEWSDRQRRGVRDRPLVPPSLPRPAHGYLQTVRTKAATKFASTSLSDSLSETDSYDSESEEENADGFLTSNLTDDNVPVVVVGPAQSKTLSETICNTRPSTSSYVVKSKYAGRALAEWALVVSECDNFFHRRREEGVPCDEMVEVPTLGVETFRKC